MGKAQPRVIREPLELLLVSNGSRTVSSLRAPGLVEGETGIGSHVHPVWFVFFMNVFSSAAVSSRCDLVFVFAFRSYF